MKKKKVLGMIVIFVIFSSMTNKTSISTSFSEFERKENKCDLTLSPPSLKSSSLALTPHEPIIIENDANFTDYGFPGLGTAEDPYIIENYSITTVDDKSVFIYGTSKYFTIRSCYVDASSNGINLFYVSGGTALIENNTCIGSGCGIYIRNSVNVTLINNFCSSNTGWGIRIEDSNKAVAINNTCTNSHSIYSSLMNEHLSAGILLISSSSAKLINNTCTYNTKGISIKDSLEVSLLNNTISNNGHEGIHIYESPDTTLEGNTCINNVIYLCFSLGATLKNNLFFDTGLRIYGEEGETYEDYLTYTIENNWVNDKRLGFYCNQNQITLSEPIFGQLIFINCDNIDISNQEVSNLPVCFLHLKWCESATISNIICNINLPYGHLGDCGILLEFSSDAYLTNNKINNTSDGICLDTSSGATITDNICSNGVYGIYLAYSSEATVMNNTCYSNLHYGINLYCSDEITISNNTCRMNECGIRLHDSDSCFITYNLIRESYRFGNDREYGLALYSDSDNNIIHHNSFINNNPEGTSQASDWGINNIWYEKETKEGNYWSEWDSRKPYPIDGNANSTDPYPLKESLEKIYFELIILLPSIFLIAFVYKYKTKKKEKTN